MMHGQTDKPFGPSPGPQGHSNFFWLLHTQSMLATNTPNLVGFHPMVKKEIAWLSDGPTEVNAV